MRHVCPSRKSSIDRWWRSLIVVRALPGLLIALVVPLTGTSDLAAQISIAQMYHKSWTPRDGAPDNIESIAEGADGFLWLAADTGLYRFDGVSFYRYKFSAGSQLLSNKFTMVHATRDGSLWISYVAGGLARLKDGVIRNYTEKDGVLPHNQIGSLVEDSEGSIWTAGAAGLQKITSSQVTTLGVEEGLNAGRIFGVAVDQEDNLWVTQYHQLVVLPHGSKRFIVAATWPGEELVGCAKSKGGGVWSWAPNRPIVRFRLSAGRILRTVASPSISMPWHLKEAEDGAVWVATQTSGIVRFYPNKKEENAVDLSRIEAFGHRDGLTDNFSFEVAEDAEGSIWVATINGLDQFRSVPFRAVDVGQNSPVVLPQGVSDPHFIVATDHITDLTGERPTRVALPVREMTWTRSLFRSDDGDLWIGANGHLWRYAGGKFSDVPLPQEVSRANSPPVLAMVQDANHKLWISLGSGYGIFQLDGKQWRRPDGLSSLPKEGALSAVRDSVGAIWFGFRSNRLVRISGSEVTSLGKADGLDVGDVSAFAVNTAEVWAAGEKGVALWRPGGLRALHLAGGAALQGVTGLVFSPDGALWINGFNGVLRIDKAEIDLWGAQPDHAVKYRSFDSHDGLRGVPHPIVGLGSARMAPDGKLYIATRTNLQWIDPLHIPGDSISPSILITTIKAGEEPEFSPGASIRLSPNVTNLQISYTASSLLIPERVKFRYRLVGYDRDWVDAGTRRQAFYSRLPPGSYTFKVVGCNDSGIWNEAGASILFTVPPTFTQTAWFELLCLIAIGCIAMMAYRLRMRQVAGQIRKSMYDRVAERERIARDLHDTFFQSIQGLLLRFNTATSKLPSSEPTKQVLEDTLKQSDQVMLEGRRLVMDLRAPTLQQQADLAVVLAEHGKRMQADYGSAIEVAVQGDMRLLHPLVCDEILNIGKEALSNAFRHSGGRSIEAELNYEPKEFRMSIRDDGSGIDPKVLEQGHRDGHWGLPGMRERAKAIGGQLDIWSRAGSGTEIQLRLAADIAYAAEEREGMRSILRSLWTKGTGEVESSDPF